MSALLPCPFCGDQAEVTRGLLHGRDVWSASCCADIDADCCGAAEPSYFTREAAIAAWNARRPSPATDGGGVSEEMVEAARRAASTHGWNTIPDYVMRAAIESALAKRSE